MYILKLHQSEGEFRDEDFVTITHDLHGAPVDDTQPGNPNKTPKRVLFGITQMIRTKFGMCEVVSRCCNIFRDVAIFFGIAKWTVKILVSDGKVDK